MSDFYTLFRVCPSESDSARADRIIAGLRALGAPYYYKCDSCGLIELFCKNNVCEFAVQLDNDQYWHDSEHGRHMVTRITL